MTGSKNDLTYAIDLHRVDADARTRVSAAGARGRAPILSVLQRGMFSSKTEALRTGDITFDSAYLITTGSADDVEGLRLVTQSLLVLANRCSGVWLHADGLKVTLSWLGFERDPLVLDAARDAVVTVAGWHRPDSPYR
ncbi:MAG TPA: hypothetical protein VM925_13930 [Labilithrix sp.]|nr:hypothetical protein [Labilithrix sp.]